MLFTTKIRGTTNIFPKANVSSLSLPIILWNGKNVFFPLYAISLLPNASL